MKKIVLFLTVLAFAVQPADAQFFKKLFKKKAKTERTKNVKSDGIDDALQVAMGDITSGNNDNNRNAFLDIPLGIKADRFELQLFSMVFKERKEEGPRTGKSYIYEGTVYGAPAVVTLAVSEQTARVYAVDVQESTMYNKETVVKRFEELKNELEKVYGRGFIDNQGEGYTIQTRLGTVNMHYERSSGVDVYSIGFALDDAKAYKMAYGEMADSQYETAPRTIENGLAAPCNHTDLVGLGVNLMQNRTVKGAQKVLRSYNYKLGKITSKAIPATFIMDSYEVTAKVVRRRQNVTSAVLTATDDMQAVCRDLQTYGYTSDDQKTWRQGKIVVVVDTDKQGRVVATFK